MKNHLKIVWSISIVILLCTLVTACDFFQTQPDKPNQDNETNKDNAITPHPTIIGGAHLLPETPKAETLPELIFSRIFIDAQDEAVKFISITNTTDKTIYLKNYKLGQRQTLHATNIYEFPQLYLESNATIYILNKCSIDAINAKFPNIAKLDTAYPGENIPANTSMKYTGMTLYTGEKTYEIINNEMALGAGDNNYPLHSWNTVDIISLNGKRPTRGTSAIRIYESSTSKDYGWRLLNLDNTSHISIMDLNENMAGGTYIAPTLPKHPNGTGGGTKNPSNIDPALAEKKTRQNIELGMPIYKGDRKLTEEQDLIISRPSYTLSFNHDRNISNWVSWHIDSTDMGHLSRPKEFKEDPYIVAKGWEALGHKDYQYSEYAFDKGHLCPNGDRRAIKELQLETFYMTNIIPQAGENNQHAWAELEEDIRLYHVKKGQEVYVISGPSATNGGNSVKGNYKYIETTHTNGVTLRIDVPEYTWKVVIAIPDGDNDIERINANPEIAEVYAVWMPNSDKKCKDKTYDEFKVSINFIEQMTGYDFFPDLDDTIEEELESINYEYDPIINPVFTYENEKYREVI